ncbi:DNA helicase [Ranunculus cassubicifolius]
MTLRQLFVSILLHCEVTDPRTLWEQHWLDLSQDALHNKRKVLCNPDAEMTEAERKNVTLCEIEILLNDNNKSLKDYKPMPVADMRRYYKASNRLIQEELDYNCDELRQEFEEMHAKLNSEQEEIFSQVTCNALKKKGGFFFVYGSGGTGKTFLWKTIIARLRSEGKIVLPVASSGIASLLLQGGRTAHSRFKIPIEVDDSTTCNISQQTDLAELIRISDLVIWDEAPMNHRNIFEAVDKTLRDLMKQIDKDADKKPFGGKTVVLGGDFRQVNTI